MNLPSPDSNIHMSNLEELNQTILSYFQAIYKARGVNKDTRLIDLGFESIHYIELAAYLLKTTGRWLNISTIHKDTNIAQIASSLSHPVEQNDRYKTRVRLDDFQRRSYAHQLYDKTTILSTYVIHYLHLKEHVEIPKLKTAILDTLKNHFLLNSKIIRLIDDYFFEETILPSDIMFRNSFLFSMGEIAKLQVTATADRLVNIYLKKTKKNLFLIISFHHLAMDGWAFNTVLEEIFRRYAGLYGSKIKKEEDDLIGLSQIYNSSLNEQSNTAELKRVFDSIAPYQYNHLDHVFLGKTQLHRSYFVIKKNELDRYSQRNNIDGFATSTILVFLVYQLVSKTAGVDKIMIHVSFSNRNLPIKGIKELVANLPTCHPLFLSKEANNNDSRKFVSELEDCLKILFKHMSYGAITRILLENTTLLNEYLSPYQHKYYIMFTYINNVSKAIYGDDSITKNYIDWLQSETHLNDRKTKYIFFNMHNFGSEFYIQMHTDTAKHFHSKMVEALKREFE